MTKKWIARQPKWMKLNFSVNKNQYLSVFADSNLSWDQINDL